MSEVICSHVDGPRGDLTKWSQTDEYHMTSLAGIWRWYKGAYLQSKKGLTDVESKHGYQRGNGGGKLGALN